MLQPSLYWNRSSVQIEGLGARPARKMNSSFTKAPPQQAEQTSILSSTVFFGSFLFAANKLQEFENFVLSEAEAAWEQLDKQLSEPRGQVSCSRLTRHDAVEGLAFPTNTKRQLFITRVECKMKFRSCWFVRSVFHHSVRLAPACCSGSVSRSISIPLPQVASKLFLQTKATAAIRSR